MDNGTTIIRTACAVIVLLVLSLVGGQVVKQAVAQTGPAIVVDHTPGVYNSVTEQNRELCPKRDTDCLRRVREGMRQHPHPHPHKWTQLDRMAFEIYANLDYGWHNSHNGHGMTKRRGLKIAYDSARYFLQHMHKQGK